jgi:hypothetical protein
MGAYGRPFLFLERQGEFLMTKSSSGLLLGAALALAATAAQAEEDKSSANYMLPLCRSTALCHGIVQGMLYMVPRVGGVDSAESTS